MPFRYCYERGHRGIQWGERGKCYIGESMSWHPRADRQMRAIKYNQTHRMFSGSGRRQSSDSFDISSDFQIRGWDFRFTPSTNEVLLTSMSGSGVLDTKTLDRIADLLYSRIGAQLVLH
jgi:hypothetical protein